MKDLSLLDRVRISAPCDAAWNEMPGDSRRRYCDRCGLHVHNLSALTGAEAERLVEGASGRLCASYVAGRDGAPITKDRPLRLMAARVRRLAPAILSIFAAGGLAACGRSGRTGGAVALGRAAVHSQHSAHAPAAVESSSPHTNEQASGR